jgi:SSS family solute:Na+ symporter
VAVGTWAIGRRNAIASDGEGHFLAGRSLTFPVIAGSLLLTNLSTEQLVGLNGAAYTDGLSVMVWEVVAVVALVAMALFFLPRFLRLGVTTVPEYLGHRFDGRVAAIADVIFLVAYVLVLLPVILYSGATGLIDILDLPTLTGIESRGTLLWLTVIAVGVGGAVYALFGGLRAVAVSDTLNGVGLLAGGLGITWFGLSHIGAGEGAIAGLQKLVAAHPERFDSTGASHQSVPASTILTGVLLLNLFYWCTNQQIIQRTFAAKTLAEGQKGVLLCGALKLLGPLFLVLPGMMAFYLFSNDAGMKADHAYGRLVALVLPPALQGLFAGILMGAILSSFNSALNSAQTLYCLGIHRRFIAHGGSNAGMMRAGLWFGLIIAVLSMIFAPLLAGQDAIFGYLQKMNGIYFIPIFSVVLMGMLTRRVPAAAAMTAMLTGIALILLGYTVAPFSALADRVGDFHYLGIVFVVLLVLMLLWPRNAEAPKKALPPAPIDFTPWRLAPVAGVVLLLTVASIYALFHKQGPEAPASTTVTAQP